MGWGSGYNMQGREVGYAIEAVCDEPTCEEKIDRGLGYCCGGMHDGGEHGCGGYFCSEHLYLTGWVAPGGERPGAFLCPTCCARWEEEHPDPDLVADLLEDLLQGNAVAVDGAPVRAVAVNEEQSRA